VSRAIKEVSEKLKNIEDDLQTLIVNLATAGKWKKWSDSIPEGEILEGVPQL